MGLGKLHDFDVCAFVLGQVYMPAYRNENSLRAISDS